MGAAKMKSHRYQPLGFTSVDTQVKEGNMRREILLEMLAQNKLTCSYSFERITEDNSGYRVNEQAASIGFIYRHIGETMNLFGQFFGIPTDTQNTTMGQQDVGQHFELSTSRILVEKGYDMLMRLIEDTAETVWLDTIETPFFGTVSRARLFSHVLFHNSHHAGQISLTLSRGQPKNQ
jgi:uncharacterized damage-inducible protein DinB